MSDSIVTWKLRDDGVAIVTLDDQSETHNTLTRKLGDDFQRVLNEIAKEPNAKAIVVASGKPESFIVGANIDMLSTIKVAADAEAMSRELAKAFAKMRAGEKPVVAAVHGQALGGGFELALACHAIVVSDDKKTTLALPEVQLGLLPGAHGLLYVAERVGIQIALDLGLTGKNTRATKAKKIGLVDEIAPVSILIEAAAKRAKELIPLSPKERIARTRRKADAARIALEKNPLGRALLFKKAREALRAKTHGHYPGTERIVDVLERYGSRGFEAAAELEAKAFGELVVSETSKRLVEIFFATTALKKDNGTDDPSVKGKEVGHVAMLGGGLMGGGIAYVTMNAGIPVRLKDRDDEGIARGVRYVRGILDERVKKKQITKLERDRTFSLLTATTDYSGLKTADIVIEAVFEDLALKHRVLKDVEANTREDCVFASNTSSLPIGKIAEGGSRPENVVGMHYFSPVHKMPLLEVIATKKTRPEVIATAVALGKKQGKTVIVVNDGVAFYTSRILAPYMNEASFLLSEGVPVDVIDRALVDWGWPVGALQLADEVGMDVAEHVGEIVLAAFGDRMQPPPSMRKLITDDRKGRKNGRGFYLYGKGEKKGKRQVDTTVYDVIGVQPTNKVATEEIQMRCALAFVNEAMLCLGESILRSPRDGDIGAIFGLGFPPFRGGPFRYVDTVGATEVLRRIRGYEERFGARFTPAPLLVDIEKRKARFHAT